MENLRRVATTEPAEFNRRYATAVVGLDPSVKTLGKINRRYASKTVNQKFR